MRQCDRCYLLVEDAKSWVNARYYCKQLGGDLVTIKDGATHFFLSRYISNNRLVFRNVYIGTCHYYNVLVTWYFSNYGALLKAEKLIGEFV